MIGWIILALVLVFLAVILIRTAAFTPKAESRAAAEPVSYDKDAAIHALAELVKCRTVSYDDHALEDDAEFEKLIGKLPELFPNVAPTYFRGGAQPNVIHAKPPANHLAGSKLQAGDTVEHRKFGRGTVIGVKGNIAQVAFAGQGIKELDMQFAPMEKI